MLSACIYKYIYIYIYIHIKFKRLRDRYVVCVFVVVVVCVDIVADGDIEVENPQILNPAREILQIAVRTGPGDRCHGLLVRFASPTHPLGS